MFIVTQKGKSCMGEKKKPFSIYDALTGLYKYRDTQYEKHRCCHVGYEL